MVLFSLGVALLFLAYKKKILQQQKEHQRKEAEYQKQLLRANLKSQEQERNRIGRDLHDGVGSLLTTSKMYFSHLEQDHDKAEFEALKQKVFELLDDTINSVRRVSLDLRPVVLEQLGLSEALTNLVHQLNKGGDIKVDLNNSWQGTMPEEFELNWFRIVQELLNNTLKHAEATEVGIQISENQGRFVLIYEDNGKGLSQPVLKETGLGMRNIESRLHLMEGHMQWMDKSTPGIGLRLSSITKASAPDEAEI